MIGLAILCLPFSFRHHHRRRSNLPPARQARRRRRYRSALRPYSLNDSLDSSLHQSSDSENTCMSPLSQHSFSMRPTNGMMFTRSQPPERPNGECGLASSRISRGPTRPERNTPYRFDARSAIRRGIPEDHHRTTHPLNVLAAASNTGMGEPAPHFVMPAAQVYAILSRPVQTGKVGVCADHPVSR